MSSTPPSKDAGKAQQHISASPPVQGEDQEILIAELTIHKWESAGKPRGQWEVFWLEAEQELLAITSWVYTPGR